LGVKDPISAALSIVRVSNILLVMLYWRYSEYVLLLLFACLHIACCYCITNIRVTGEPKCYFSCWVEHLMFLSKSRKTTTSEADISQNLNFCATLLLQWFCFVWWSG
jgi:hypothetical protein